MPAPSPSTQRSAQASGRALPAVDGPAWSVRDARLQLPLLLASDRPVLVGGAPGAQGVVMSKSAYDEICDRAVFAASTLGALNVNGLGVTPEAAADLEAYVRGALTLEHLRRRALDRYDASAATRA